MQRLQLGVFLSALLASAAVAQPAPAPPAAAKKPHETTIHGDTRADDYFWLRDKKDPAVLAHLEAENAYAEAMMKGSEALQQKLYEETVGHVKETDLELPFRRGDFYYYTRTEQGKQYPIRARKKGSLDAAEEIVLDLNVLAAGHEYFDLDAVAISDDGNLVAYTTDTVGAGQYTLSIKDLRTGELLPEKIERVARPVWAADNKTLFYVTYDNVNQRLDKLFRHTLGSSSLGSSSLGSSSHVLVFHETDELFQLRPSRSSDRAFLLLDSYSKTTTETRYLPANEPAAALRLIAPRRDGHTYVVDHGGDRFYIRTNDRAPNYRLVTASDADPSTAHWKELIAPRRDVELFEVNVFEKYMAVSEVQNGNRTIRIVDLRTGTSTPITFGEPMHHLSRDWNPDFQTTKFVYRYNSLLAPESVYEFDMETHANRLLKRSEAPNYDPSLYAAEQVWATAPDGTKVPVSIVYRKPLVRDGKRPMLLYGYGAYGQPLWPFFVRYQLPLLDRGVVYAIAHVRGGGGMGQPWREAGRMMTKRNSFTDFVAAAEHLVKQKVTSSDRLVITSRSAGGLLVTAAANLRPQLFKAVVTTSPFVDVLNTMLDASLPLTTSEYVEWGNPNVKKEYDSIKSYSPYDNLRATAYPAMLVQVSLNDRQVGYWEGTKFVARLRALKTNASPVLLRVNMAGGHAGSSGRYDALREYALEQAFTLRQMGIDE